MATILSVRERWVNLKREKLALFTYRVGNIDIFCELCIIKSHSIGAEEAEMFFSVWTSLSLDQHRA